MILLYLEERRKNYELSHLSYGCLKPEMIYKLITLHYLRG